jgi:hypothetical protein
MEPTNGIAALRKLADMGYRFTVNGAIIKARYEGQGAPDPTQVRPLLELARQHKEDVRYFLKRHCPQCGGVTNSPCHEGRPLCLACDWTELVKLYPALAEVKH